MGVPTEATTTKGAMQGWGRGYRRIHSHVNAGPHVNASSYPCSSLRSLIRSRVISALDVSASKMKIGVKKPAPAYLRFAVVIVVALLLLCCYSFWSSKKVAKVASRHTAYNKNVGASGLVSRTLFLSTISTLAQLPLPLPLAHAMPICQHFYLSICRIHYPPRTHTRVVVAHVPCSAQNIHSVYTSCLTSEPLTLPRTRRLT